LLCLRFCFLVHGLRSYSRILPVHWRQEIAVEDWGPGLLKGLWLGLVILANHWPILHISGQSRWIPMKSRRGCWGCLQRVRIHDSYFHPL
jgi:hypothetical protein